MRAIIYSRTGHPTGQALLDGFRKIGASAVPREQKMWMGEVEQADIVLVNGMKGGKAIVAAYTAAKVPVLVYDFGYMKRVNQPSEYTQGYWQVGLGGLNRLPSGECPGDRFAALGVAVRECGGQPWGRALVCGQVPDDAAHGLDASCLRQWLKGQLNSYRNATYRPHPLGGIAVPGFAPDSLPLADSLARSRLVVTYNSNIGNDALLAGVPVVAAGGGAVYQELSRETLPSVEERMTYFHRLAYAQWSVEEMAEGVAQRYWVENYLPRNVWD